MDTMKDTKMQPATDAVIAEVKLAAEHPLRAPVIVRADAMLYILARIEQLESDLATAEQDSRQKQARIERLEQEQRNDTTETTAILRQLKEWRRDADIDPPATPAFVKAIDEAIAMIDRLEAAESARRDDYQNWMTALDRNAELLAKLEAAEKELAELRSSMKFRTSLIGRTEAERDALRAKVEQMERQEPVAWLLNCPTLGGDTGWILSWTQSGAGLCNRLQGEENEKKLYALPGAQPAPSFADAYQGAMEEAAIWKKRALEAEDLNRKFIAEINGPTHMGEPAPSVPDDMIEQAVTRFLSWKLPKDFHPDGGMVFIPTKGRGYDSPHWPCGTNLLNAQQARDMLRYVLAAPEVKS